MAPHADNDKHHTKQLKTRCAFISADDAPSLTLLALVVLSLFFLESPGIHCRKVLSSKIPAPQCKQRGASFSTASP